MRGFASNTNIKTPKDNETLYRYMDFYKFVSLVSKRELFFCKASAFDDPLECCFPRDYYETGNAFSRILTRKGAKRGYVEAEIDKIKGRIRESLEIKSKIGVVSFCAKDYEYDALWRLYSNTRTGVCILTNTERLKKSLSKTSYTGPVFIGKVGYRNYESEFIGVSNKFAPIFTKRKEFESENEVRVVVHIDQNHKNFKSSSKGFSILVDTAELIEEIILSPQSDEDFHQLVVSVLEKNEIDPNKIRIRRSNLYDPLKDIHDH